MVLGENESVGSAVSERTKYDGVQNVRPAIIDPRVTIQISIVVNISQLCYLPTLLNSKQNKFKNKLQNKNKNVALVIAPNMPILLAKKLLLTWLHVISPVKPVEFVITREP